MSTLATPTATRDWRILPNIGIGGLGTGQADYQYFWWVVKCILCNQLGQGTWLKMDGTSGSDPLASTVVQSCDSITAPSTNADTTDRWNNQTKVVCGAGGSAYSWVVLSMPGMGVNAQLEIAFAINAAASAAYSGLASGIETGAAPSGQNIGGIFFSHSGGFDAVGTLGTTTRRSYAADEVQIFNRRLQATYIVYLGGMSNSATVGDWNGKLHVMRTSDGSETRMVFCQNGVPTWYFILGKPSSAFRTNGTPDHRWNVDDLEWFGAVYGSATGVDAGLYNGTPAWLTADCFVTRLASNLNPSNKAVCKIYPVTLWSQAMGDILIAANNTAANLGDGGYIPQPIGLACGAAGYIQPYLGTIDDLYFIGNNLTNGASGADNGSTASWRKFGNFLFPWAHGVTVQMS